MNLPYPNGVKGHMLTAIMVMVVLVGGFYAVGALNASTVAAADVCPAGFQYIPSGGLNAGSGACARLTVVINHQEATYANPALLAEGFTASCLVNCNGVIYTLDPTVLITNSGHDFEQCKVYGSAGSITCTSGDSAVIIGLSESATTPATGDTSGSGPCKVTSPSNELTSGGLADAAGTVSPGVSSATVTTTIAHTFTAAETDSSVQVACLQTELHSGGNVIIYAEGTFGPDSLVLGNTIAITWTVART